MQDFRLSRSFLTQSLRPQIQKDKKDRYNMKAQTPSFLTVTKGGSAMRLLHKREAGSSWAEQRELECTMGFFSLVTSWSPRPGGQVSSAQTPVGAAGCGLSGSLPPGAARSRGGASKPALPWGKLSKHSQDSWHGGYTRYWTIVI